MIYLLVYWIFFLLIGGEKSVWRFWVVGVNVIEWMVKSVFEYMFVLCLDSSLVKIGEIYERWCNVFFYLISVMLSVVLVERCWLVNWLVIL